MRSAAIKREAGDISHLCAALVVLAPQRTGRRNAQRTMAMRVSQCLPVRWKKRWGVVRARERARSRAGRDCRLASASAACTIRPAHSESARAMADSRYNFSLTTFDKSGRLGQIDHALKAVENGDTTLGIRGEQRLRKERRANAPPPREAAPGPSRPRRQVARGEHATSAARSGRPWSPRPSRAPFSLPLGLLALASQRATAWFWPRRRFWPPPSWTRPRSSRSPSSRTMLVSQERAGGRGGRWPSIWAGVSARVVWLARPRHRCPCGAGTRLAPTTVTADCPFPRRHRVRGHGP